MKALSDLSGVDIKNHENEPAQIVRETRHWFVETVGLRGVASPTIIWDTFNIFLLDFREKRKAEGFSEEDLNTMPVPEFIAFIRDWIRSPLSRMSAGGRGAGGEGPQTSGTPERSTTGVPRIRKA